MKRQRGYSLVEMGVALVILGLLVTGVVAYWTISTRHQVAQSVRRANDDARLALTAFAQAKYRLPCPDLTGSGLEGDAGGACPSGAQVGGFPWKTVGIFDPAVRRLRYGLYRAASATAAADADLSAVQDRLEPLRGQGSPLAVAELSLGHANLLDFCKALEVADRPQTSVDATRLHTWQVGQATSRHAVAYVLASGGLLDTDGDGSPFDGANATASSGQPAFERPGRAATEAYDDVVTAVGFQDLFHELGCGAGMSAIDHAHANAALSTAMLRQGIHDYRTQLKLLADAAGAGVASATAKQLMTGAALSKATATMLDQTAVVLTSQGALSAILATGTLAIIANTASTVTAAGALAAAIAFKVEADGRYANVGPLVSLADAMHASVDGNFLQADQSGF